MSRIAFAAAALIGLTGSAQGADLPYGPRAPYTVNQPLNAYSWAGPYLGGNIGYGWGSIDHNPTRPSGFAGGVQGGQHWAKGPVGDWPRSRHPGQRRQRYFCAVEILQSVVRHRARPGRLRAEQRAVLR